jgi:hypothetical protein
MVEPTHLDDARVALAYYDEWHDNETEPTLLAVAQAHALMSIAESLAELAEQGRRRGAWPRAPLPGYQGDGRW